MTNEDKIKKALSELYSDNESDKRVVDYYIKQVAGNLTSSLRGNAKEDMKDDKATIPLDLYSRVLSFLDNLKDGKLGYIHENIPEYILKIDTRNKTINLIK